MKMLLKMSIWKILAEGDSVVFGETYGDKGPQASWVRSAG